MSRVVSSGVFGSGRFLQGTSMHGGMVEMIEVARWGAACTWPV
jgi:hypothetical protein